VLVTGVELITRGIVSLQVHTEVCPGVGEIVSAEESPNVNRSSYRAEVCLRMLVLNIIMTSASFVYTGFIVSAKYINNIIKCC